MTDMMDSIINDEELTEVAGGANPTEDMGQKFQVGWTVSYKDKNGNKQYAEIIYVEKLGNNYLYYVSPLYGPGLIRMDESSLTHENGVGPSTFEPLSPAE